MKKLWNPLGGTLLLALLAACTLSDVPATMLPPNPTSIYQTVSARLTETGPASLPTISFATLNPTSTITPNVQLTITLPLQQPSPVVDTSIPRPSPTALPCDRAAPGRPVDLTIPDGTRMKPEQGFTKTWRLVNAGTCAWTTDYSIVWFSGESLSSQRQHNFGAVVMPGQAVDISVDMIAPRTAGIYQSNWKLRNARGVLFGIGPVGDAPFWVRIEVEELATSTATLPPLPTITATLATAAKGTVDLLPGNEFDLDTGKISSGAISDLTLKKAATGALALVPVNGARLSDFGAVVPGSADCKGMTNAVMELPASSLKVGEYVCYTTSQSLPGYLRIKTISEGDGKTGFEFLTWSIP
jgi:hypothetical protein